MKRSKKYIEKLKLIDKNKFYNILDAIKLVKKTSVTKFDSTVEIALLLGIDTKKSDQIVRGTVNLPAGSGKDVKVIVFTENTDNVSKAKKAGANEIGSDELIEKIKKGWTDFDVAIATPDLTRKIAPIARILGPKGLMPNPKTGTVTMDVEKAVQESKSGKIEFRVDKDRNLHFIIGKCSFNDKDLEQNYHAAINEIKQLKPPAVKGKYILKASISTTMGPSVQIQL